MQETVRPAPPHPGRSRARPCRPGGVRKPGHRLRTDLDDGTRDLNQKLAAWWELDFRAFRCELRKAFAADLPLAERADWEQALAAWQTEHRTLTARLVDLETAINDRVAHLFELTPGEHQTLANHMRHAMIDYPLGEVRDIEH